MNKQLVKTTLSISLTALLAGCGGSGTSTGDSVVSSQNQSSAAPVVVQSTGESQVQNDTQNETGAGNGNASVVTSADSGDTQVQSDVVTITQSDAEPIATDNGNTDSTDTDSMDGLADDEDITTDDTAEGSNLISDNTYPGSVCVEPASTSVSFEDFDRT